MTGNRGPVQTDFQQFKKRAGRFFGDLLQPGRKVFVARAPGRLDVMGGIADYCGSLVLEMPLREATLVGVQRRRDRRLVLRSLEAEQEGLAKDVELSLDHFRSGGGLKSYRQISSHLRDELSQAWAAYVAGVFFVLEKERLSEPFRTGATICISSAVPFGAGIASSAAVEVATLYAVLAAYGLQLDGLEAACAAQLVENRVAGAPCGIMDQVTAVLGRDRALLALRCQPHSVEDILSVPTGFRFVGIESRVKHAVGGSRYTDTRVGAFMGHKILLSTVGKKQDPFQGYLTRITPCEYMERFRSHLPARISGGEFLKRYGDTLDPVTKVEPGKCYAVRSRVEHPIYENNRVERFRSIMQGRSDGKSESIMAALGRLMYASHWSYGRRCAMGSSETDLIVRLVRQAGPKRGLFGAKITGGGCGGTVAVLAADGTDDDLAGILDRYAEQTGFVPRIFKESSPGAEAAGTDWFKP
ncbi:MAG: galactokinase family protein [bacterium]